MTIDFACKKFEIDEVVKCGLGLTKSDLAIMYFLIKNKKTFNSNEIASKLKLDLSTVQRSLKILNEKNIIVRSQNNLSSGGYLYIYKINEKKIIKDLIMETINSWTRKVELELDRW